MQPSRQLFGSAVKTGHISKSGKEKMLPRTEKQPLTSVEESPSWIQKKKQTKKHTKNTGPLSYCLSYSSKHSTQTLFLFQYV